MFYNGSYDFFAAAKAQAYARWVEDYAAQQEEVHELRRYLRSGRAARVGHKAQASDGDKLQYNYRGGRVESSVAHNIRAAEEKLRRIEDDPVARPPQPLRINSGVGRALGAHKAAISLQHVRVAYGG